MLPLQDMRVGTRTIRRVPFVTPATATRSVPDRQEDGILATVLFDRVYINHSDHYVILNPKWFRRRGRIDLGDKSGDRELK